MPFLFTSPHRKRPATDYAWLADKIEDEADRVAEREEYTRWWSHRQTRLLQHKLVALEARISERWRNYRAAVREDTHAFSEFILSRLTDREYIEAMFELYSQQRTRLL